MLFAILALSVLIFISNFNKGGVIGSAFHTFFFGTFGVLAYVFPFWLFFFCAFLFSNLYRKKRETGRMILKLVSASALLVFLCAFAHLIAFLNEQMKVRQMFDAGAKDHTGGGVVGGVIGGGAARGFGTVGAFVLVLLVLVLAVVLLTEKSFFRDLSRRGQQMADRSRVRSEERRQEADERRRERDEERVAARRQRREEQRERARREAEEPSGTPQSAPEQMELNLDGVNIRQVEPAGTARGTSGRNVRSLSGRENGRTDAAEHRTGTRGSGVSSDLTLRPTDPRRPRSRDNMNEIRLDLPGVEDRTAAAQEPRVSRSPSGSSVLDPVRSGVRDTISADPGPEISSVEPKTIPKPVIHISAENTAREFEELKKATDPSYVRDAARDTSAAERSKSADSLMEEEAAGAARPEERTVRKTRNPDSDPQDNERVANEIKQGKTAPVKKYVYPTTRLLAKGDPSQTGDSREHLMEMSQRLQMTLTNFGVDAHVTDVTCGPSVTRYEIQPEIGVKVSKIVNLADDIKLNLAVPDIRIEAPIPGKAAIGIEVPNKENVTVPFRELIESREFKNHPSKLSFCTGKDIGGKIIIADIAKMPHVLIAGATGSGKSVCINTIIMSILFKASPQEVRMIMIDPKVVELSAYNGIPHLLLPVVTDPKKAAGALNWGVAEMTNRYQKFAEYNVRDLKSYNKKVEEVTASMDAEGLEGERPEKMPQILIIVDELADLMMAAPGDVEGAICRLAQLARACGIHLVIATQRPSVNVITGLIKANMPSRIAFAVTSGVDSRTILDMNGAEKLLGKGDMLFYPQDYKKPLRVQGSFVSDGEVADVVSYVIAKNGDTAYSPDIEKQMNSASSGGAIGGSQGDDRDAYFAEAGRFIIDKEKGSIGSLQRMFKVGFNRAARIMDQLEEAGVVGPEEGTKPRRVLMTSEEFEYYLEHNDS